MSPKKFDPGPLADAEHHVEGERSRLVFKRRLRHSPEKVWAALTDADQIRKWAPFDADRDLGTKGPATLRMTDGGTTEEFASNVRDVVAPTILEYTWGDDLLRWELTPDGTGTQLTLHHTVDGASWVPRTAAGWHLCLYVADRLMEGKPIDRIVGQDAKNYGWDELHDAYASKLGIASEGWPEEVFRDG
jgi:uncharacterized protein YndB with AHSA1/START domain